MDGCAHPKSMRALLHGYDVTCGKCEQIIGRVALFPSAVLTDSESDDLLALIRDDGESRPSVAVGKLRNAARSAT